MAAFEQDREFVQVSPFETELGWFGIVARNGDLTRIRIGHDSCDGVIKALLDETDGESVEIEISDWDRALRDRLTRYASGEPESFEDVEVVWPEPLTQFRKRVIREVSRVGWGQRISYGELAGRVGSPRAARAVGTTMATNRFPIVIPCHRVIQSGGRLGGFSTPQGTALKHRMLAMESPDPTRQS